MRSSVYGLGLLVGAASANINFFWVNPTCNYTDPSVHTPCLTGQHCIENNT